MNIMLASETPGFWQISLGNVLSMFSILIAVLGSHLINKKRVEDTAERLATMQTKIDIMYGWFQKNVFYTVREFKDQQEDRKSVV